MTDPDPFETIRLVLTVTTFGFSLIPVLADFNKTHATNPLWTGHARFHVVWQCLSSSGLGFLSLYMIWFYDRSATEPLYLSFLFGVFAYGGFFGAVFFRRVYGGELHDENGYLPISINLLVLKFKLDLNICAFSGFAILLGYAFVLLRQVESL